MKSILTILTLLTNLVFAETYKIGIEPMPPFINDAKSGYSVEMLKALEKEMPNDKFVFEEAPYNRLKTGLKDGSYDMVGHTPYGAEVKEFYEYAEDVNWQFEAITDLYVVNKDLLKDPTKIKQIGTPRGNKEFAAELTGIPVNQFYDQGTIDSLLAMLKAGRIDGFWFPRATTLPIIKSLGFKVYFKAYPAQSPPIAFSTSKSEKGKALKSKVETALKKVKWETYFKAVLEYNKLGQEGEFN